MSAPGAVPVFGDPALLVALLGRENGRERQPCLFCRGPVVGRPQKGYCSDRCRAAAWKARKARLRRDRFRPLRPTALRILARLQQGPVTARELGRIAGRYGARIHELRGGARLKGGRWPRHQIHCYVHRLAGEIEGHSVYWSAEWMLR